MWYGLKVMLYAIPIGKFANIPSSLLYVTLLNPRLCDSS